MPKTILTPENRAFIRGNYREMSGKAMARHIGCRPGVVQRYMRRNGLTVTEEQKKRFRAQGNTGRTSFSPEEDARIRAGYLDKPIKALADEMGRSWTGIMGRLKAMGLAIPDDIVQRNKESARIKKGNVPINKGKKQIEYMDPEAIGRSRATRFKKGNVPPNTKERDGVIAIRNHGPYKYKYIRVAPGKWVPCHVHIWERANGPVPKGHCLWFVNGDTLDLRLENLELITRKENYRRNSASVNLTDGYVARTLVGKNGDPSTLADVPELLKLKRNQLKLNRKIKNETDTDRKQAVRHGGQVLHVQERER